MALTGDLASVGLADVFQMLAHNQKVGVLSIKGKDAWKALYFDRRGVTLYYAEHGFLDRLLDSHVRRNHIAGDLLDNLRRDNSGDPVATVEALLQGELIQEELFLESFRMQMEEEIYDLFLWENVHWEFLEGESAVEGYEGVVNENFFFSADSLIMEAARRLDEWVFIREQVPGPTEVFETVPGFSATEVVGLDELTLSILDLVDGKRSVQRMVEISNVTSFEVHKAVSILRQKGFVQPLAESMLIENAHHCIAEARLDDGLRLLERAVQVGASVPEANLLAARTYEMQCEVARASWHYKCYAAHKIETGAVDEAVETLEHTIGIVPTDLEAWERLVHGLMLQAQPNLDPHAVGRDLIDLYLELDETDRARSVLEDLLRARPNDIELKKSLIAVYTKADDAQRVMELYESIADDLVQDKDPIGAVRYLQKILMIDRNRREISDRIKQLYVMDEKHRSRRRSLALVLAGLLCTGTLGTIYYLYERNVWKVYESIDLEPLIKNAEYGAGIRMLDDFLGRYPLSFVGREVSKDIERLRGLEGMEEARRERVKREKTAAAHKLRQQYKELWGAHEKTVSRTLDLAGALARLEQVQSLARQANEAVDKEFLTKHEIEKTLSATRSHLGLARKLEAKCEDAWRRGAFKQARLHALGLHTDFRYTPSATRCLVPFEVITEPQGAQVFIDGQPVRGGEAGLPTTPLWIRLKHGKEQQVKLSRVGYEDLYHKIKGSDRSPIEVLLRVVPDALIKLEAEPVTGIGVGESVGLVGLRGGKLAAINLVSGEVRFQKGLPGLDEVHGTPLVFDEIGVFATTNGRVYAIRLDDGQQVWSQEIPGGIVSSLVSAGDGIVLVNRRGDIVFLEVETGTQTWSYSTGAPPSTDPMWDGHRLFYVNRDGLFLALETDDPDPAVFKLRDTPGAVCPPLRIGKQVAFLGLDGSLRGFAVRKKAPEAWNFLCAGSGTQGFMLPDRAGVIVVTEDGLVRRIDPRIKRVVTERRLPMPVLQQPVRSDRALFLALKGEKGQVHLVSLDAADLSLRWDYVLPRGIRGVPTVAGQRVFVVGGDQRIHVLK